MRDIKVDPVTPREIVRAACIAVTGAPIASSALLEDVSIDSLQRVEIGVEIETRIGRALPKDEERSWETVADIEKSVAALLCPRCGDTLRERRSYCTDGTTSVGLYCYGCENDDLTRLARIVGK